jgi:LIM domain
VLKRCSTSEVIIPSLFMTKMIENINLIRNDFTTEQICVKPVYRMDPLINLDGSIIHKQCAKCEDCNCQITLSNFFKSDVGDKTTLLCKTHYLKRFAEVRDYLTNHRPLFCFVGPNLSHIHIYVDFS